MGIAVPQDQPNEAHHRGILKLSPLLQFGLGHGDGVVSNDVVKDPVLWIERLDQDPPLLAAPARAARDLGQQLKRPLQRPEVRKVQHAVRLEDADHAYPFKIQPLCHHLRAHQDLNLPRLEGPNDALVAGSTPGGIQVHPRRFDA